MLLFFAADSGPDLPPSKPHNGERARLDRAAAVPPKFSYPQKSGHTDRAGNVHQVPLYNGGAFRERNPAIFELTTLETAEGQCTGATTHTFTSALARRASGLQQCDNIRVWGPSLRSRNGHESIIQVTPISGAGGLRKRSGPCSSRNERTQPTTLQPKRKMNIW
jgi:hypothetical protein